MVEPQRYSWGTQKTEKSGPDPPQAEGTPESLPPTMTLNKSSRK